MSNRKIYIYGLTHPKTGEVRYIGKTVSPKRRLWDHISDARRGIKTYKHSWIRSLLKRNLKPAIVILEVTNENDWQEREQKWITHYSKIAKLTNLTDGGDGLIGYKPTEESIEKNRQAQLRNGNTTPSWKGRKQSPEHIRKRVEARKKKGNYRHSEEIKKKISRNRKGKNMGNTHTKGRKLTEEHKRKVSEGVKRARQREREAKKNQS